MSPHIHEYWRSIIKSQIESMLLKLHLLSSSLSYPHIYVHSASNLPPFVTWNWSSRVRHTWVRIQFYIVQIILVQVSVHVSERAMIFTLKCIEQYCTVPGLSYAWHLMRKMVWIRRKTATSSAYLRHCYILAVDLDNACFEKSA